MCAKILYLKGQNSSICSGHNLIVVCKIDGANAFVWSAPPLFANQIANSMIMNGTKSLAFFSFLPQPAEVLPL